MRKKHPCYSSIFYDKQLAQASYMVGCAATGEAVIIDPARNIAPYLQVAEEEGFTNHACHRKPISMPTMSVEAAN